MKKFNQNETLVDRKISTENITSDKIKTTNVNILLNRVRLDKKRFKKKIYFSLSLVLLISSLVVYLSLS